MLLHKLWMTLLCGFFVAKSAPSFAASSGPISPAAAWAQVYLLNTVFVAEHAAALAAAQDKPAFVASDEGRALLVRRDFAVASAQDRSQRLLEASGAATSTSPSARVASTPATVEAIAASFGTDAARAANWSTFAPAYALGAPLCSLSPEGVLAYAAKQNGLVQGASAPNPTLLLAEISGFDLARVQCLLFALMATEAAEPLHLMRALQQGSSPFAHDTTVRSLLAVRYVQLAQYAESLRVLMDLTDIKPAFRLPYDIVQRVFGFRQKGEGAVALRGP